MDDHCSNPSCLGVEYICMCKRVPSFFCDCKLSRLNHVGHQIQRLPNDQITLELIEIQKRCSALKSQVISQAEALVSDILEFCQKKALKLASIENHCELLIQKMSSSSDRKSLFVQEFKNLAAGVEACLSKVTKFESFSANFSKHLSLLSVVEALKQNTQNNPKLNFYINNLKREKPKHLNLSNDSLDPSSIEVLVETFAFTKLVSIDLSGNSIKSQGVSVLVKKLPSTLEFLDLRGNDIDDSGAIELSKALSKAKVKTLVLWSNQINQKGADALAEAIKNSCVTHLHLMNNPIPNLGMQSIIEAIPSSNLVKLDVEGAFIGKETKELLQEACSERKVELLM